MYINRKVFQPGVQISHSFQLILPKISRSNKNIFAIKTLSSSYILIIHPFSNLNLSACSGELDLHNHSKKLAKYDDRIFTYLKCSVLNSCPQVSTSSRSSSSTLSWSFMHKEVIESTQIQLNFRNSSSCSCTRSS